MLPGQRSGWFAVSELSTQNVSLTPIMAQRRRNLYASRFCAGSHIEALIGGNSIGNRDHCAVEYRPGDALDVLASVARFDGLVG
jgi:hypothetical protein